MSNQISTDNLRRSIDLNDSTIPTWIRQDLKANFDTYTEAKGLCTKQTNIDDRFSYFEFLFLMGDGSFERALAKFQERYPGYVPNFLSGTISREESNNFTAQNNSEDTGSNTELVTATFVRTLTQTLCKNWETSSMVPRFSDQALSQATTLLSQIDTWSPNVLDPTTLPDMQIFFADHPEIDGATFANILEDFFATHPEEASLDLEDEIFDNNADVLEKAAEMTGPESAAAFVYLLWPIAYLWDTTSLGEYCRDLYDN